MKIHINKNLVERKGFFGGKGTSFYVVHAHYELNSEEKELLNGNLAILDHEAFDFPFRGPDGRFDESDSGPTYAKMIDEKLFGKDQGPNLGCVPSNAALLALEEKINEGAKRLKGILLSTKGAGPGSSTTEI